MDLKLITNDLYSALGLGNKIIGVKFISTKEDFAQIDLEEIKGKLKYCVMVKKASSGRALKAGVDNFGCIGAIAALGIGNDTEPTIEDYMRLGLFANEEIATLAMNDVTKLKQNICGVILMPLEEYPAPPDAAIILANSYQAMRVIQGYTYHFGVVKNVHISGNQALCSECTATPYLHQELNISTLCSGTRFFAKWDDTQLAVGLPISKIELIHNGILSTINSTENDERKKDITNRSKELNRDFKLTKKTAYYY